ncbi:MAG: MarR family transcriptional regulator [Emcibacter sp.]|nr:MarR family transcriptional regulator [Emcibacter sp.]
MRAKNTIWKTPGFLIRRLQQIQVAVFLSECQEEKITPIQWGILTIVTDFPNSGHIEISEELGLDRSNVANVVTRLVDRGLLSRITNKEDRRRKSINVTEEGLEIMKKVRAKARRAQDKVLGPLEESEREIFMELLGRLVRENNHLGRTVLQL